MVSFGEFFIYMYCLASLTVLLADGSIFEDLKFSIIRKISHRGLERYVSKFLFCPMCIGFWVGILSEIIFWYLKPDFGVMGLIFSGASVSISSTILYKIVIGQEDI
jgi:hypothetical protein